MQFIRTFCDTAFDPAIALNLLRRLHSKVFSEVPIMSYLEGRLRDVPPWYRIGKTEEQVIAFRELFGLMWNHVDEYETTIRLPILAAYGVRETMTFLNSHIRDCSMTKYFNLPPLSLIDDDPTYKEFLRNLLFGAETHDGGIIPWYPLFGAPIDISSTSEEQRFGMLTCWRFHRFSIIVKILIASGKYAILPYILDRDVVNACYAENRSHLEDIMRGELGAHFVVGYDNGTPSCAFFPDLSVNDQARRLLRYLKIAIRLEADPYARSKQEDYRKIISFLLRIIEKQTDSQALIKAQEIVRDGIPIETTIPPWAALKSS
jgi:hypothetical protein